MSVPMKSHLSPAWTISIASTRNITLRGDRREGREEGGEGERREGRERGEGERREERKRGGRGGE